MRVGWKIKTIGDVCSVGGGSTPRRAEKAFWDNGTYPWFSIDDIRDQGRIITDTKQKITKLAWSKMRVFPANSVLLCCTASLGEYALSTIPITSNQQFNGLTIKNQEQMLPMYLFYFCSTLKPVLQGLSGKATIDFVSSEKVRQIRIPVPSIQEQQRIVDILDQEFAKIDALKANAEKSLKAAKDLFQATLKKELKPKEGWKTISIGSVAKLITKGASPKWQGNQYVSSGGIMFITSENVREGFLDISSPKYVDAGFNKKQARSILKKDDVLVNIVGASIGRAAIFTLDENDANINQAVALVRLCQDDVLPDYLCCFLNSSMAEELYSSMKKDTARANLSLENISNIEFPCPAHIFEQQIITEKLLAEQQKCRQIENNCKMTLALCDDLKQAILRKAINGEL